jgi:hypothetical protein
MIGFIDDHRAVYGVEPICRVRPIAPSTYHAHAAKRADPGKRCARERRDTALHEADIRRVLGPGSATRNACSNVRFPP